MDIYSYLKKDHKTVRDLFQKVIAARSNKSREKYFDKLKHELLLHAETENETFYQALRQYITSRDCADHGKKEHDEIKSGIRKLNKFTVSTTNWLVQFGVLKHTVEHHIHEEEHEMFKIAKEVLSDKQEKDLAKEMDELKHQKTGKKRILRYRTAKSHFVGEIARIF